MSRDKLVKTLSQQKAHCQQLEESLEASKNKLKASEASKQQKYAESCSDLSVTYHVHRKREQPAVDSSERLDALRSRLVHCQADLEDSQAHVADLRKELLAEQTRRAEALSKLDELTEQSEKSNSSAQKSYQDTIDQLKEQNLQLQRTLDAETRVKMDLMMELSKAHQRQNGF